MQRVLIGRVVATVGAVTTVAGTLLPWVRSGERRRGSYEVFSLIDRLGISPSSLVAWGLKLWPILPFLVACAVTFQWFPQRWLTGGSAIVVVVYAGVVSAAVRSAPSTSLISVDVGPLVTLMGAIVLAGGALLATNLRRMPEAA